MAFLVTFGTGNDDFTDLPAATTAQILRDLAKSVLQDGLETSVSGRIHDTNGNWIGIWEYEKEV